MAFFNCLISSRVKCRPCKVKRLKVVNFDSGLDDGKAEKLLLESFRRHSSAALKEAQEKRKRMEEIDRKRKEKAEAERRREEEELKKRSLQQ